MAIKAHSKLAELQTAERGLGFLQGRCEGFMVWGPGAATKKLTFFGNIPYTSAYTEAQ